MDEQPSSTYNAKSSTELQAILDLRKCHQTYFCTPSGNYVLRPWFTHINHQKKSVQHFHPPGHIAHIPPDYSANCATQPTRCEELM